MAKAYNGFTPHQRAKAGSWLKREIEEGRRESPHKLCCACGQTKGYFQLHSEDYSEPYGSHIGAFNLCYACHMILHCRWRNSKAWEQYTKKVRQGFRLEVPFKGRLWSSFLKRILYNLGSESWVQGEVPETPVLDLIGQGFYKPWRDDGC